MKKLPFIEIEIEELHGALSSRHDERILVDDSSLPETILIFSQPDDEASDGDKAAWAAMIAARRDSLVSYIKASSDDPPNGPLKVEGCSPEFLAMLCMAYSPRGSLARNMSIGMADESDSFVFEGIGANVYAVNVVKPAIHDSFSAPIAISCALDEDPTVWCFDVYIGTSQVPFRIYNPMVKSMEKATGMALKQPCCSNEREARAELAALSVRT